MNVCQKEIETLFAMYHQIWSGSTLIDRMFLKNMFLAIRDFNFHKLNFSLWRMEWSKRVLINCIKFEVVSRRFNPFLKILILRDWRKFETVLSYYEWFVLKDESDRFPINSYMGHVNIDGIINIGFALSFERGKRGGQWKSSAISREIIS